MQKEQLQFEIEFDSVKSNSDFNYFDSDKKKITCKQKIQFFMNNQIVSASMAILTLYSIFAVDIEKAFFDMPRAIIFGIIHIFCISLFLTQMVLNFYSNPKYPWGFYFWIDTISNLSMTLEVIWLDNLLSNATSLPVVFTVAKVIKASRLSKVGARAVKFIALFIAVFKKKEEVEDQEGEKEEEDEEQFSQSKQLQSINLEIFESNTTKKCKDNLEPIEERIEEKSNETDKNSRYESIICQNNAKDNKNEIEQITPFGPTFRQNRQIRQSLKYKKKDFKKKRQNISKYDSGSIIEKLEKAIILHPLKRQKVDPEQQQAIQKKWQELIKKQKQRGKIKQKVNKQNFRLGQTLKEQIQKNIIILIMGLIICLPLIDSSTWMSKDPDINIITENYINMVYNSTDNDLRYELLETIIDTSYSMSSPLIQLDVRINQTCCSFPGDFWGRWQPLQIGNFMESQKMKVKSQNFTMIFNEREFSQLSARISLVRSAFIAIFLIFSTIIFMNVLEQFALAPIEVMCNSINKISANPFEAMRQFNQKEQENIEIQLQTHIMEKTIFMMSNLLLVGVGQMGSEIVSEQIDDFQLSSNKSLQSSKMFGIFLYIKIANAQNMFQNNIVQQTNKIAQIIHQTSVIHGGIPIENDGNGFLLFWQMEQASTLNEASSLYFNQGSTNKQVNKYLKIQKIIQLVLKSYKKINIQVNDVLKEKKQNCEEEFENCYLQAGIHYGSAFHGSFGSNFKLESKFVGETVYYVKKLCQLAANYHVSNLISEQVINLINNGESNHVRKADYIIGREDVGEWIYTHDFSLNTILNSKRKSKKNKTTIIKSKEMKSQNYKKRLEVLQKIETQPLDSIFKPDQKQIQTQSIYKQQFYDDWSQAIENYYSGQWDEAVKYFEFANGYVMESINYKDPLGWLMIDRIRQMSCIPPKNWARQPFYQSFLDFQ